MILPGFSVEGSVELILLCTPNVHFSQHKIRELVIAIFDDNVFDLRCRFFTRPGRLPCRAVSVEACAGGCDPVAEALSSVHEITVPSQWCRSVLFWVVGTEPVQV